DAETVIPANMPRYAFAPASTTDSTQPSKSTPIVSSGSFVLAGTYGETAAGASELARGEGTGSAMPGMSSLPPPKATGWGSRPGRGGDLHRRQRAPRGGGAGAVAGRRARRGAAADRFRDERAGARAQGARQGARAPGERGVLRRGGRSDHARRQEP